MTDLREAAEPAAVIEAYYEAGWTDGLPVVPPSDASVAAMLAAAGLHGHEVLGEIPGRNVEVVAEKAAINAVMAGCRPEYMPVVVAAVKGLCAPAFAYHGPASSTGGSAIVLVVHGPIGRRLGINAGNNAFGQGHRPNATIGRAVRLCMMNVMNTRPGLLDRATLGHPGKYTFCFAEHELDHPWQPLHTTRGFAADDSTVTVYASNSLNQVYNQLAATPEPLLLCFADALGNMGSPNLRGFNETLVPYDGRDTDGYDIKDHELAELILNPTQARERLCGGIYKTVEPTNPLGLLQEALVLSLNAEPLEKRIRIEGQKTGKVTALDLSGQIQQALAAGVINEGEADFLREYDRKVMNLINVDDFAPHELDIEPMSMMIHSDTLTDQDVEAAAPSGDVEAAAQSEDAEAGDQPEGAEAAAQSEDAEAADQAEDAAR